MWIDGSQLFARRGLRVFSDGDFQYATFAGTTDAGAAVTLVVTNVDNQDGDVWLYTVFVLDPIAVRHGLTLPASAG